MKPHSALKPRSISFQENATAPNQIFRYFANFARPQADGSKEMRARMIQYVEYERKWFGQLAAFIFSKKKTDVDSWLTAMRLRTTFPDELAIHTLAKMCKVQVMILGHDQDIVWTTNDDLDFKNGYNLWFGLVGPLRFRIFESNKEW